MRCRSSTSWRVASPIVSISESFWPSVKFCTFPGMLIADIISFMNRSSCMS